MAVCQFINQQTQNFEEKLIIRVSLTQISLEKFSFFTKKTTKKRQKKRQKSDNLPTNHRQKNRELEKSDSCRYFFWPVGAHPRTLGLVLNMRTYEWDSLRDIDSLTDMLSSEFEIRNDTPLFLGKIVGTSRTGSNES